MFKRIIDAVLDFFRPHRKPTPAPVASPSVILAEDGSDVLEEDGSRSLTE